MPNYTFKNTETGEEWTETLTIAARDEFMAANPHVIQLITNFAFGDPYRLGVAKKKTGMRKVLQKIKETHRGSTVDPGNITEI